MQVNFGNYDVIWESPLQKQVWSWTKLPKATTSGHEKLTKVKQQIEKLLFSKKLVELRGRKAEVYSLLAWGCLHPPPGPEWATGGLRQALHITWVPGKVDVHRETWESLAKSKSQGRLETWLQLWMHTPSHTQQQVEGSLIGSRPLSNTSARITDWPLSYPVNGEAEFRTQHFASWICSPSSLPHCLAKPPQSKFCLRLALCTLLTSHSAPKTSPINFNSP